MYHISQAWVTPDNFNKLFELLQIQGITHYCQDAPFTFLLHSVGANMRLVTAPPYNLPRSDVEIAFPVTLSAMYLSERQPVHAVSVSTLSGYQPSCFLLFCVPYFQLF